ncbi:MAG: hypothetical protein EOP84_07125 [Verrucomicrobiaceae bacterium]|nr:MAG: hypothetical protein EOP84_07125 [Verrucomicrobiaceae bacterium]
MLPRLFVVCLLLCLAGRVSAQEKKDDPHWIITAECQMILVPQKLALELIPELSDDGKIDTSWERGQKLIVQGEIEVLGKLLLKGDADEKMVAESIEEMRYPIRFDTPNIPHDLSKQNALEVLKAWPAVAVIPTSFETRNIGQTLEMETFVSDDGQWIDMNVVAQHIRFLRWVKFDAGRLANGERLSIEQPHMHVLRNTQSLRMRNGQRVLLGVHRPPEPNQKSFELFVLQVKATKAGTEK